MTFLEFLNKKAQEEKINEGFKSSDLKKAHELMLSLFKKNISNTVVMDPTSRTVMVNDQKCEAFLFMQLDGVKVKFAWCLNYLSDGNSNEVYSIDFFDGKGIEDMMWGSGVTKSVLSIYTLGSSIAYFIPIICHVVNTGDTSLSDKKVKKLASQIFNNSPKNESIVSYDYFFGAQKYTIFENLDLDTIEETYRVATGQVLEADSELQQYRWKKKSERDEAYAKRNDSPEAKEQWKKLSDEYNEIVRQIKGGAQSVSDLKFSVKKGSTVKVQDEGTQEAEEEIKKQKEDPKVAFKKMQIYVKSVLKGLQPGVILCGAPGIGKTYRVLQQLRANGYKDGHNMYVIKGNESPRQLYIDMYEYKEKGKIIVIDDADALVGPKAPEVSINILKAALDSTSDDEGRLVTYKVTGDLKDEEGIPIPKRMYFNAGVIVITNYGVGQLDTALRGRVFTQTLDFDTEQILEIIKDLIPKIDPTRLSNKSKMSAYEFLLDLAKKGTRMEISIRTFASAARLFQLCEGEDLTEEQVKEMIGEQMRNQALTAKDTKHF